MILLTLGLTCSFSVARELFELIARQTCITAFTHRTLKTCTQALGIPVIVIRDRGISGLNRAGSRRSSILMGMGLVSFFCWMVCRTLMNQAASLRFSLPRRRRRRTSPGSCRHPQVRLQSPPPPALNGMGSFSSSQVVYI